MKLWSRSRSIKAQQRLLSILMIVSMVAMLLPAAAGTALADTISTDTSAQSLMTDYMPTINEVVDASGFTHPGIGLTKDVLENLRTQVRAQQEPWISYFDQMLLSSAASKTVTSSNQSGADPTKPGTDAFNSQGVESKFIADALKAYTQAILYVVTGDETYRANALHIIRIWSQMDPGKYAYYTDAHIHAGIPMNRMVTAAEMLRYTSTESADLQWTDQDTANFTNNLINPAIDTFLHSNSHFMNQHLYPLIGAMSGYIFTGNRERYNEGVEWFTVNASAVDQGQNGSIKQLFRLVDTNANTGEKVDVPQVQIAEMGRDQAHSTGDVINVSILSRLLMAQGTKVDPVTGTVSTAPDAVTTYDFLGKRILQGADYFARFMLGYDTPWIPTAAHTDASGNPTVIYQQLNGGYRGRIGGNVYDLYYYYKYSEGLNMEQAAPYFTRMFNMRLPYWWESADAGGDYWLYIPKEAAAEGTQYLPKADPQNEFVVANRYTGLDGNSTTMQEGDVSFVRITATESGSRIALVGDSSGARAIGFKIRTNGAAKLEAFGDTITLPDTKGQWRYVYYAFSAIQGLGTLNYFTIKGNGTTFDIESINTNAANELTPPVFTAGDTPLKMFAYAGSGAALHYDFSATDTGAGDVVTYQIDNSPDGAAFDTGTGAFAWQPAQAGTYSFVVEASDGTTVASRDVTVTVTNDRQSAVDAAIAPYDANTDYVWSTLDQYKQAYKDATEAISSATDEVFYQKLAAVNDAVQGLKLMTPLLADGSVNYPDLLDSSTFGNQVYALVDNAPDSFAGYYLAQNLSYYLDFGPSFRVSANSFGLQVRAGFPERIDNVAVFGSDDKVNWTRLTPDTTQVTDGMQLLTVPSDLQNEQFRFLKVQMVNPDKSLFPGGTPMIELSEFHIFGLRHEVVNTLSSVSIGSDQAFGGRIVTGDSAKLTFQSTATIQNVRATIQGIPATVHSDDGLNWTAEAVMGSAAAPGPVTFKLDYQTTDGVDAAETLFTTDGSHLILSDNSDVVQNIPAITVVSDSSGRSQASASQQAENLFDGNPGTITDYRVNGGGSGGWVEFDFGPGGYAQLTSVELLARQDGYYSRINGAIIQGSNDNVAWTTISTGAVSTQDWQALTITDKNTYRYIRIYNGNNWYGNMAEARFHGTAKVLTKVTSVSMSSDQGDGNLIEAGSTVKLAFTAVEPINTVKVKIAGQDVAAHSDDNLNWTAETATAANASPDPVTFSINYKTADGDDAPEVTATTDGSGLIIVDKSKFIDDSLLAKVTASDKQWPGTGLSADQVGYLLFDGNTGTYGDLNTGAGAYYTVDMGEGAAIKPSEILLMPRAGASDRMNGIVIQGSNDNASWTNLTEPLTGAHDNAWSAIGTDQLLDHQAYRYLRIYNSAAWYGNISEVRLYGDLDFDAAYLDSNMLAPDGYTEGSYYQYQQQVNQLKAELDQLGVSKKAVLDEFLKAGDMLVPVSAIYPKIAIASSMVTASSVSWDGKSSAAANGWRAFDGNTGTYPDTKTAAGWVLVDLGEGNAKIVSSVKYIPRSGFASRMNGAQIQGSNDGVNFDTLYTVSGVSAQQWYSQAINSNTAYRFLRYYSPNGYANVGELEFYEKIVDRTLLPILLDKAAEVAADHYTDDSYAALQTAVSDAKSVNANAQATQSDVDAAAGKLKTALNGLIYKISASLDPAEPNGLSDWYTAPVTVTLSTYGKAEYSTDGGNTWQGYTAPITLDQDGKHTVNYRSRNEAGIAGNMQSVAVNLDATAPTIAVTGLVYGTYNDSMDITPIVTIDDNMSGGDGSKTTVTLDTNVIHPGEAIPLYTLPLGTHKLVVTASDLAGNTSSKTVTFETTTSIQSLQSLVTRFTNAGWIQAGLAKSLQSKLANNELTDFVSDVQDQNGKLIISQAAEYLLRDARYLASRQ